MNLRKEILRARSVCQTGINILGARQGERSLTPALLAMLLGLALFTLRNDGNFDLCALATALLFAQLFLVAIFDARYMLIPIWMSLGVAITGLGLAIVTDIDGLPARLAAGALSYLLMRGIDVLYVMRTGRPGLGAGDAHLLAGGSLWIGLEGIGPCLLLATLSALMAIVIMRFERGSVSKTTAIPFGPHLAVGIWLIWLAEPLAYSAGLRL